MEPKGEAVFFEVRDEAEYYTWRAGRAECDPGEGVITVYGVKGKTPAITIAVSEIAGFEITMREGISILPHVALGLALGEANDSLGCLLALILAPAAVVERVLAKRARFPVIQLTQSDDDRELRLWIRSRRRGRRGREETRVFASHLADVLRGSGCSGVVPDLSNNEIWFRTS